MNCSQNPKYNFPLKCSYYFSCKICVDVPFLVKGWSYIYCRGFTIQFFVRFFMMHWRILRSNLLNWMLMFLTLNKKSPQKGAAILCVSGCTVAPPTNYICIHKGYLLGNVKSLYLLYLFLYFRPFSVFPQHAHNWVAEFQFHNRGHKNTRLYPYNIFSVLLHIPCLWLLPVTAYR